MKFVFAIVLCICLCDGLRTVLSQEIGEQCSTTSRDRGICMPQRDCVERENVAHHNEFEQCKLNSDGTPIICCVSNLSKSPTTKREQTSHSGGSNEVTSSDGGVETKFYNPKKKTTYSKQSHKSTSSGKNIYHNTEVTFNTNYHKSGNSFGDYDSYSPSPATFDTLNYYDPTSNRRPESNYGGSKGNSDYYGQSTSSYGNRPTVATNGQTGNRHQTGSSQSSFSSNSNKNENRDSNKGSYDNGYYPNRPSDNSNYYPGSSDSVYYPGGSSQRPSSGNGFSGSDGVYYPNSGSTDNRPSSGGYRPGSSSTSQQGNNRPSSGGQNNGGSQYENGWPNQNRQTTSTRRPSNHNEEPLWGTTERTTTRRATSSGQRPSSSSYQQQKRISEQKCSEYSRTVTSTISAIPLAINGQATTHKVTDCQVQATSLVVGGSKAKLGEFPHMAALGFRSSSSITYNCGGTLISEEYVLTAAHCTHSSLGNPVVVRLGDLNLLEEEDDGAQPQTVNVASVTVHPNYKPPQIYHDIALIKLARRISFDKNLRPACLQVNREVFAEKVVATGWGSTNYGEISSDDLLKVGLDIIDSNQCNTLYGSDQKFPKGITSSIMCAGDLSGKKDTCQGDSGGPLQVHDSNNKCIHYVIGITSSGKSCGLQNSPGLYTRVSEYVPWIESIVWRS